MPGGYVNITDNADPMDIMVYRTAAHPSRVMRRHGHRRRVALPRQVCKVPIFSKGASADESSLISAGRIMIAEDNYGYTERAAGRLSRGPRSAQSSPPGATASRSTSKTRVAFGGILGGLPAAP